MAPDRGEFIVKTLAVHPRWHLDGMGTWLVAEAHRRADKLGWTAGGIHALMWTGSHSRKITAHAGQVFREYALYDLAADPGETLGG